jgi:hypothetical protein
MITAFTTRAEIVGLVERPPLAAPAPPPDPRATSLVVVLGGCPRIGIVARKWGSEAKLA